MAMRHAWLRLDVDATEALGAALAHEVQKGGGSKSLFIFSAEQLEVAVFCLITAWVCALLLGGHPCLTHMVFGR